MKKFLRDRWMVNLVLVVVIVVLLSLLLLEEEPEPTTETLASYLPDKVNELRILRQGKHEIHFRQADGHWHMLAPYQARAESSLIEQLLSLAALEVQLVANRESINPVNFGLAQPAASIHLNQTTIHFGDEQPVNRQRYIDLDGKVMLIPGRYMMHLKAGSISYIDRQLVPKGHQIQSLTIGGEAIDPDKDSSKLTNWQSMKSNWVSLAADDQQFTGTDIHIIFLNDQPDIHYVAEQSDNDMVLTNTRTRIQHHLPMAGYGSLGINFETEDDQATHEPPADADY